MEGGKKKKKKEERKETKKKKKRISANRMKADHELIPDARTGKKGHYSHLPGYNDKLSSWPYLRRNIVK